MPRARTLAMTLSWRKQSVFEISSHEPETMLRVMTEMTPVIRVLVADDFPMVRDALSAALNRHPNVEVAGTAADGLEAVEQAHALRPDVIVLDLRMPGMSGLMALTRLTTELPSVRVLLLTASEEPEAVIDAVSAGAAGFVTKRISGAALADAVCAVHRGEPVIDPSLTAHLVAGLRRDEHSHRGVSAGGLTGSELNVLRLVADGRTDKQISKTLFISPRTVQSHLAQIRTKVGLRRRVELTRWAAEHMVT
jgi:DNA-binding NarL/FixJ family response regulator